MIDILIDNQEIKSTWGISPMKNGFFNVLYKFPDAKDRESVDLPDENGVKVYASEKKMKSREITLQFLCDSYSYYKSFLLYLRTHPTIILKAEISHTLEYMACTDFKILGSFNNFSIKFRESITSLNIDIYITTESGNIINTEDSNKLIKE